MEDKIIKIERYKCSVCSITYLTKEEALECVEKHNKMKECKHENWRYSLINLWENGDCILSRVCKNCKFCEYSKKCYDEKEREYRKNEINKLAKELWLYFSEYRNSKV